MVIGRTAPYGAEELPLMDTDAWAQFNFLIRPGLMVHLLRDSKHAYKSQIWALHRYQNDPGMIYPMIHVLLSI